MSDIALQTLHYSCIGTGVFIGYCFALNRCADAAQPIRMALAEQGEEAIAQDPDSANADDIAFCLETTYCGWIASLATIIIPFTAIWNAARAMPIRRRRDAPRHSARFLRNFAISAIAANPIFGLLAAPA